MVIGLLVDHSNLKPDAFRINSMWTFNSIFAVN